ncbi:AAA family ATPase [Undibacterium sp. TC4M20W]|uniref:AAA family ATPase n=1 Tax=unclassified Undibacterium TaxID=2630295 RepID=UPI003BF38456
MRISQIHFLPNELSERGIDCGITAEIKMPRLGQVVVLAGPNGSGKTRLLNALTSLDSRLGSRSLAQLKVAESENNAAINHFHTLLDGASESEYGGYLNSVNAFGFELKGIKNELRLREMICYDSDSNGPVGFINFVPLQTTLLDAEYISSGQMRDFAESAKSPGLGNLHESASSYLKDKLQIDFNSRHPDALAQLDFKKIESIQTSAKELKDTIKLLLGTASDPRYTVGGKVSLFGRDDYYRTLSSGQKLLLQLAVALHAQNTRLKEAILILDEPENHLHPTAIIELVTRLKELCTDGQIWIATHCVPLIAHLVHDDPNCLWYVNDGQVSWSGRQPERVLNGLMGGQSGADRLQQFTLLPAQFATARFLSECLLPPGTVGADTADPQTNQIARIIHKLRSKNGTDNSIRVLDFGAGQGRLLSTILSMPGDNVRGWLDYHAFDSYDDDKERCMNELTSFYSGEDVQNRYFNELSKISAKLDAGSFDLVVMCNVLHEIDPDDWIRELGKDSHVAKLLKDDGYLLIVEDYLIPVGETAHRYGFLLLDEAELKKLFGVKEKDCSENRFLTLDAYESKPEKSGRLKAHLISAALVRQITSESRLETIKGVKYTAQEKIESIKKKSPASFNDGQRYALFTQLYANASIWLSRQGD